MQFGTREYWKDKTFNIAIAGPIGSAITFALTRVYGWLTFDSIVIGVLVAISLWGVVEFVRWERRRKLRAVGLRGLFLSHAATLRSVARGDEQEAVAHAAAAIRGALNEHETKYFWQQVSQVPTEAHPKAAAAYLEALAERPSLEPVEPLSYFL